MNFLFSLAAIMLQGTQQQGSSLLTFLPFILIIVIMYFFIFRPQAKKQKDHKAMVDSLKKGDKVLTSGGIYGTIAGIREKSDVIIVKIADNVKVEVTRSSVSTKVE